MNVFPGPASIIDTTFSTKLYKGFLGRIDKIQLEDGILDDMATFNFSFSETTKVLFLAYKTRDKFFLIMIKSKKDFDLDALKLLNLDGNTNYDKPLEPEN